MSVTIITVNIFSPLKIKNQGKIVNNSRNVMSILYAASTA